MRVQLIGGIDMEELIVEKNGQVFKIIDGKKIELKQYLIGGQEGNRYPSVALNGTLQYVHRLVWETFNGGIPEGLIINHLDGNKKNNDLSNLELMTHSENIRHAFDSGLHDSWKLSQIEVDRRLMKYELNKLNNRWFVYDLDFNIISKHFTQEEAAQSIKVSRQAANNSFREGRAILKHFYICKMKQLSELKKRVEERKRII